MTMAILNKTMIMGCGESGLSWASNGPLSGQIVGLDHKIQRGQNNYLILGDVFSLPIRSASLDKIYADFIVNGLIEPASRILENPDLIDTDDFPKEIRYWFTVTINRSHDVVRKNIKGVSTTLKTIALREMWRTLANNGSLQIIDLYLNTNWIEHYAS